MRYKFSSLQKFVFYETTLGSLFLAILLISIAGFTNHLLIGFLISLPLLGLCIFCFMRFAIIHAWVEIQEEGIFVCTKKGKCLRFIPWKEAQRVVISQDPQNSANQYLCVSLNRELSPVHFHMPGIIWAIFYSNQTISVPCDDALVSFCTSRAKENGYIVEFTGSGRQSNSAEMQALRKKNDRRYKIALIILLFVCVTLLAFVFFNQLLHKQCVVSFIFNTLDGFCKI